jgi:hypothetical protein
MAEKSSRTYWRAVTGEELVDPQLVGEVSRPLIGARMMMVEDRGSGTELVGVRGEVVSLRDPGAI